MQRVNCSVNPVQLDILYNGDWITLTIRRPNSVNIKGTGGATVDFNCGPQDATPVVVEYIPEEDPKLGTDGDVRSIEFN